MQVLTLEDWEIIMYSVIRRTNFGSVFYFVAWVVLGKYTFLTLFLAVTLEAFESKYDVEASSEAYLAYKSTPYIKQKPVPVFCERYLPINKTKQSTPDTVSYLQR